jgi:hypothetical protein
MVPAGSVRATVLFGFVWALAACGENNRYAAPPPPKVTVALPVEPDVTRYFDATAIRRRLIRSISSPAWQASYKQSTIRTATL